MNQCDRYPRSPGGRACIGFPEYGFTVIPQFLCAQELDAIIGELDGAPAKKSTILFGVDRGTRSEASIRSSLSLLPGPTLGNRLCSAILAERGSFARELHELVSRSETPQFLQYEPGDGFVAHSDTARDAPGARVRRRRVSIVIFLNSQGRDYEGGSLVIHGTGFTRTATASGVGLCIAGVAGTLVAFRSTLIHEVQPVTSGVRRSAVTWLW